MRSGGWTRSLGMLFMATGAACGGGGDAPIDGSAPADASPADASTAEPVVTITSHADDERVLGSRSITLAGTLVSPIAIDAVDVLVDDVPVTVSFDQTVFTASIELGDGTQVIVVSASSANGTGAATIDLVYPYVALTSFQTASRVIGQANFTTGTLPAASAWATPYPFGKVAQAGGTLYVPSSEFNRVLGFAGIPASDGADAAFAVGQPDLTTTTVGAGSDGMEFPETVQAYGGRLYVNDYSNGRVLGWSALPAADGFAPDFVVGQADLEAFASGCAQDQLNGADDVFVGAGVMLIGDSGNNRLLVYDAVPTANGALPALVLGHDDFTTCDVNDGNAMPSASTLNDPRAGWTDGTRLFVPDTGNNRVLVWNTFPTASFTPADFVLGQPDFTTSTGATTATGMRGPISIASNGNQLAVADDGNNRVLVWNSIPSSATPPDVVLGQGDLDHGTFNDDDQSGGADTNPSARTLHNPVGVEFVFDVLAVTDINNHRVLLFGPLP